MKAVRLLLLTFLLAGSASAQVVISGGSGGGISSVSSLPGTCTPGTTGPVNLTIAGFGYGVFYCRTTNTWTPDNPQATINPLAYGARMDVKKVYDCTFTVSAVINCTQGDVAFTAADVGKIAFGTKGSVAVGTSLNGALACPQTTILSFQSATQVTLNAACTIVCTPDVNTTCGFAWGTQDDTSAINTATNAAWNNGMTCFTLQFPNANYFFSSDILFGPVGQACGNGTAGVGPYSDLNSQGPEVFGQGQMQSVGIPLPNFTFPCTHGSSGKACIGSAQNMQIHDMGWDGMQQGMSGSPHNVNFFELDGGTGCAGGSTAWNIGLAGWGLQSSTSVGFDFGRSMCNDPVIYNINVQQWGATSCNVNTGGSGNTISAYGLMCFGANTSNLTLNGTGIFNSYGGNYFTNFLNNAGIVNCTGGPTTLNSFGDSFASSSAGSSLVTHVFFCNGGAMIVNLIGSFARVDSIATGNIFFLGGGNTIRARDSVLKTNGTARTGFMTATDFFYDEGGNSWTLGSAAATLTNFYGPGHSLQGSCTGVGTAASTLGLYGTGPNIVVTTCTSAVIGAGVPMTGSGNLQILTASASAAGTNASSGVVTVLKNGGATALTCTIGTGTSCTDGVHSVAFVAGDLISIQFTTQAADTLAGVKAMVEWN